MSNAEQERIEKAWEEAEIPIDCVLGDNKWAVMKNGFRYGFLAGQADAMVLPEVRAEELEEGKFYVTEADSGKTVVGLFIAQQFFGVDTDGLPYKIPANWFDSFRGPLQMGDWK